MHQQIVERADLDAVVFYDKPILKFARLLEFFREQGVRVQVASFKPSELPALVVYPQGAETAREASQALEAGDLPPGVAGLVGQFIDDRFGGGDDLKGTLYLNAACPLVLRLAEQAVSEAQRMAALTVIPSPEGTVTPA